MIESRKNVAQHEDTSQSSRTPVIQKYTTIQCALHGTTLCPKPVSCSGYKRKCDVWVNHSCK